jgi:formylglycine-generating enzyme
MPIPKKAPAHSVSFDGFWIHEYAVTNRQFAPFVAVTGYCTAAERSLNRLITPAPP